MITATSSPAYGTNWIDRIAPQDRFTPTLEYRTLVFNARSGARTPSERVEHRAPVGNPSHESRAVTQSEHVELYRVNEQNTDESQEQELQEAQAPTNASRAEDLAGGYSRIPNAFYRDGHAKRMRKAGHTVSDVYGLLCSMANNEDKCWPGVGYIADTIGILEETVTGATKWLEKHRYIAIERTNGKENIYRILPLPKIETEHLPPRVNRGGSCKDLPPGVNRGATHPGEPGTNKTNRTTHTLSTNRHTEKEPTCSNNTGRDPEREFSKLWESAPTKTHKTKARGIYAELLRRNALPGIDVLCETLEKQAKHWSETPHDFPFPGLQTWLSGERWEDEIPTGKPEQKQESAIETLRRREAKRAQRRKAQDGGNRD